MSSVEKTERDQWKAQYEALDLIREGEQSELYRLRAALEEIAGADVKRSTAVQIARDALGNNQEDSP